eukprot:CAMPEP_0198218264 /NCGR_PEP_ID=MMETSP1445-20131203/68361_1 /TAXON_ID=36898 /ORGANISM="Pyramimonas sp., Strain CCMP2087" /LENGTH=156 /DNA_ID=CAMNT_0043895227 /DNA_START=226 /DNA_END=696 /DNA_ORIENTATION=-
MQGKSQEGASSNCTLNCSLNGGTFTPGQLSGLWLGEAKPDAALESEVPANPITWSLVLLPGSGVELSAFGGGYFDDCGDVPGQPVLFFTLQGKFDVNSRTVSLVKQYHHPVPAELVVKYEAILSWPEEAGWRPTLKGSWRNEMEQTFGVFGCVLQE